ncbi:MAG: hypothetical protein LBE27_07880 [Deltaproteobacteria bacterium]|jgi:hypothetical protein|nr:hypothetical protein [Deltaproteobacteria bacterium]
MAEESANMPPISPDDRIQAPKPLRPLSEVPGGNIGGEKNLANQVKVGLQYLTVAVKNTALYPENSKIRKASTEKFTEWIVNFLDFNETLKLFVDMEDFIFSGEVVLSEKSTDSPIIFPFFRDGVQWIEFQDGLDSEEIEKFLELLTRFRSLKEEDEDDLVTAMFGAEFKYFQYKTANELWEIDPLTDIASLKVGFSSKEEGKVLDESVKRLSSSKPGSALSPVKKAIGALAKWVSVPADKRTGQSGTSQGEDLSPPATDEATEETRPDVEGGNVSSTPRLRSWDLSPAEKAQMEKLLIEEARQSYLGLGADLALGVLRLDLDSERKQVILDYLAQTTHISLAKAEFASIVSQLRKFDRLTTELAPSLDDVKLKYPQMLSTMEVLDGFIQFEDKAANLDIEERIALNQFLAFLPPESAFGLVDVASKVKDKPLRVQLLGAVANRAATGGAELASRVSSHLGKDDILTIMEVLQRSDKKACLPFLIGLSKLVFPEGRETAAKMLLEANPEMIVSMPHLLSEPDLRAARHIHQLLAKEPNANVEKMIIKFLRSSNELQVNRTPETVMLNFKTLGLVAATTQAVNFCTEFIKKDFKTFLGLASDTSFLYQKGAILALLLMEPNLGQKEILNDISHSFFRGLKKSYSEAEIEARQILLATGRLKLKTTEPPKLAGTAVEVEKIVATSSIAASENKPKEIRRIKSLGNLKSNRARGIALAPVNPNVKRVPEEAPHRAIKKLDRKRPLPEDGIQVPELPPMEFHELPPNAHQSLPEEISLPRAQLQSQTSTALPTRVKPLQAGAASKSGASTLAKSPQGVATSKDGGAGKEIRKIKRP